MMLIRSMAPEVVAVDETGGENDLEALRYVMNCGCRILATVHGNSMEDIRGKTGLVLFLQEKRFERYVVLGNRRGPGTVEAVYDTAGEELDTWIKLLGICLVCVYRVRGSGGGEALRLIGRRRFLEGSKTDCHGTAGRDWVYTGSSSSGTVPGGGTRGWKSGETIFGGRRAAGSESKSVRLGVSGKRFWKSRGFVRC